MDPLHVVGVLVALVAVSTAIGLGWRTTTGRVRVVAGETVALPQIPTGATATLLQFSTTVCAPCVPTRALLGAIATARPGVQHIDVDVTSDPSLATRFGILQTPTTLILDADGRIRARIGGAPRRDAVETALAAILPASSAAAPGIRTPPESTRSTP